MCQNLYINGIKNSFRAHVPQTVPCDCSPKFNLNMTIQNKHQNKSYIILSLTHVSFLQASGPTSALTAALRLLRNEGCRNTATSTPARDPSSAQCAGKASVTAAHLPNTWLSIQKQDLTCALTAAELLRLKTTCISIRRKCTPANTCEPRLLNESCILHTKVIQYTAYSVSKMKCLDTFYLM